MKFYFPCESFLRVGKQKVNGRCQIRRINSVAGITKEGRFEALNDEVIIETNAYFTKLDILYEIKKLEKQSR